MYSMEWFSTFSETIRTDVVEREVDALAGHLPLSAYRRLLDVGCGSGRVAGPLSSRGYLVTGIDINASALRRARRAAPGPRYVALDQQHVGLPGWRFDAALVLWNSVGFVSRTADEITFAGLHRVIRPDGLLALDMYHPQWLVQNADRSSSERGSQSVTWRRWVDEGRLHNRIQYGSGRTDEIDFEVYRPDELGDRVTSIGFELCGSMVWWDETVPPSPDHARYQLLFRRTSKSHAGGAA